MRTLRPACECPMRCALARSSELSRTGSSLSIFSRKESTVPRTAVTTAIARAVPGAVFYLK